MIKKYVNGAWEEIDTLKKYDGSAWVECDTAKKYNATTQAWEEAWSNVKDLDKLNMNSFSKNSGYIKKTSSQSFKVYTSGCGGNYQAYVEGNFINPIVEITVSGSNETTVRQGQVFIIYDTYNSNYVDIGATLKDGIQETHTITKNGTYTVMGIWIYLTAASKNTIEVLSFKINGQKYNIADSLQWY